MGRTLKHEHDPRPVAEFEVAPHRYTWGCDGSDPHAATFREWISTVPYKAGEVVYLDHDGAAVKARIVSVHSERDRYGDRREKYRVQIETKKGFWSKAWFYTWAGFIQRGYKRAGLAPDIPD